MIKLCRHCQTDRVKRPRGLCWTCYYAPGVREQYPSTSKYAVRGVDDFTGRAPLPESPTDALPGTPEKVSVLIQRARLKQALWHPLDARTKDARLPTEDVGLPAMEVGCE